jgi:hypothetical protein
MKLIHHSPMGALDIPTVGTIEPGEPFDCPADLADSLLEQADLYTLADEPANEYEALRVRELAALVVERELTPDSGRRADLIASLIADDLTATTEGASE